MNTYQEAIDFIFGLINYEKMSHNRASQNYDPKRMRLLMHSLGDPQNKYRVIHVAGTKGKGSTSAMIASVLQKKYGRVGLYTSPHLVTPRERIVFNNSIIKEDELIEIVNDISPIINEINKKEEYGRVTTFETLTALAFYFFYKRNARFVVVEVGLGGRLDATNIVVPDVSVISTIGLDHTDILGDTISKIATEKAGIIKDNIPVVSAMQEADAGNIIKMTAERHHARLFSVGNDASYLIVNPKIEDKQYFIVNGIKGRYDIYLPLLGEFQAKNATLAIIALESLNLSDLSRKDVEDGLSSICWNGRFQIVKKNPFLILDGAHNLISAKELRKTLDLFTEKPSTLIIGLSDDKDYINVLKELIPYFDRVIVTKADNPRAISVDLLDKEIANYEIKREIAYSVSEAIKIALDSTPPEGLICVTGSLFVVGEALKYIC